MANNIENSSAGLKRRRPNNDELAPLPSGSHSKLDSTIVSILRKNVGGFQESKKSHAALLERIKALEHHTTQARCPKAFECEALKPKAITKFCKQNFTI